MASNNDNTPTTVGNVPPQEKSEKPTEKQAAKPAAPPAREAAATRRRRENAPPPGGEPAEPVRPRDRPRNRPPSAPTQGLPAVTPPPAPPAEAKPPSRRRRRAATPTPPPHRPNRHMQATRAAPQRKAQGVKNGTPTLDLVELKDMSIQKLNQVAKDMGDRRRRRPAQAGTDLQDPADPGGKERPDLLRGRARVPAGRLRLPARARVQLPAGSGRRVRFALADPPLRPAHRRHHLRPDPPAQGRRAVLRADQGGRHQLRAARGSPQQDLLRQPDAALSQRAPQAGDRARELFGPRDGPADAHRQRASAG